MNWKILAPCLASALLVAGCKSDKKNSNEGNKATEKVVDKGNAKTPGGDSPAPGARKALGADTDKADALWALAPESTVMGMVAVPGMGKRMHEALLQIVKTAEARPLGKTLVDKLRADAKAGKDFDPFDPQALAVTGLDLDKGAAMFLVGKDDAVAILPVGDRETFRKFTKATVETTNGVEIDKLDDDMFCTQKELYVCGRTMERLEGFGATVEGPLAKRVAALPEDIRGDAEMVIDVAAMQKIEGEEFTDDFYDHFKEPELGILSLRFGNGALRARGWYQVKPTGVAADATTVSGALGKAAASNHPTGFFSMRLPLSLMAKEMPPEDKETLPGSGIMLKRDIVGNLTGEILAYAPASRELWGTFAFGIKEGAPFKKLLNTGCGMAGGMVPGVTTKPGDGSCDAELDFSKIPMPDPTASRLFKEPLAVKAEVKADQFAITVGKVAAIDEGHSASAQGLDLLSNHWNVAMWAEGISILNGAEIPWNDMSILPPDVLDGIKLGMWMLSQVYEVGLGGAVRDDGIHAVLEIATYAGDSEPAYKAYQDAVQKALDTGSAEADFAALAKKFPGTMAARQAKGRSAGSLIAAGFTGLIAAVAIPAFTKYVENSKRAQEALAPK